MTYDQKVGCAAAGIQLAILSGVFLHLSMLYTHIDFPSAFESGRSQEWYTDEVALSVMAPAMLYSAALLINALTANTTNEKVFRLISAVTIVGLLCLFPLVSFTEDVSFEAAGPIVALIGCLVLVQMILAAGLAKAGVVKIEEQSNQKAGLLTFCRDVYDLTTLNPSRVTIRTEPDSKMGQSLIGMSAVV